MSVDDHAMDEYIRKVTVMPDYFKQRDKTEVSTFQVSCKKVFCKLAIRLRHLLEKFLNLSFDDYNFVSRFD